MQRDRSTSCRDNERPAIPSVPFKFVMFVKLESEKHLLESKSSVGSKFAVTKFRLQTFFPGFSYSAKKHLLQSKSSVGSKFSQPIHKTKWRNGAIQFKSRENISLILFCASSSLCGCGGKKLKKKTVKVHNMLNYMQIFSLLHITCTKFCIQGVHIQNMNSQDTKSVWHLKVINLQNM